MALTNYERVKRWREKNRALYNLRRRNARKFGGGGTDEQVIDSANENLDSGGSIPPDLAGSNQSSPLPPQSTICGLVKWRESRNRKNNLPVPVLAEPEVKRSRVPSDDTEGKAREKQREGAITPCLTGVSRGGQPSTIEQLRQLVKQEEFRKPEERSTMPATKPLVYRNDYGSVISEDAWRRLQERKKKAEEEGFEYDDYSQT